MAKKRIKGFAFVSKYDRKIMEAYNNFEMFQVFESRKGTKIYSKKIYTKKQWPNWTKDIKVVPCTISYEI